MYDVSSPSSFQSLTKWWNEFRERAPVREGEEEDFCLLVVGNKIDIDSVPVANTSSNDIGLGGQKPKDRWKVSEEEALSFVEKLVPRSHVDEGTVTGVPDAQNSIRSQTEPFISISPPSNGDTTPTSEAGQSDDTSSTSTRSKSITITNNTHTDFSSAVRRHSPSDTRGRSHSSVRYSYGTRPSMSSLATRESLYHTPSSSYFDVYESARSSPIPFPGDPSSLSDGYGSMGRRVGRGITRSTPRISGSPGSTISSRSSAALTITQSLFTRSTTPAPDPPTAPPSLPELPKLERRPKVFFTSAKTGEGVSDVFEYVVKRVIVRWEWDARERGQYGDEDEWAGDDVIRVGLNAGRGQGRARARGDNDDSGWKTKIAKRCCES